MSLLRRQGREPLTPEQREARSRERQERLARAREAKQATKGMGPNEAKYGLYIALVLIALGLLSYLSKDFGPILVTKHGKTVTEMKPYLHPFTSLVLAAIGAIAAGTLRWRLRMRSGIVYMLAAVFGLESIYPKGYSQLNYVAFALPAVYVMWMLMFRMNKEQREYVTAATQGAARAGNPAKRRAAASATTPARGRRKAEPELLPTGRPVPPKTGRYTPPKPKQDAKAR
ncbi:MAG TPA: hypothetical protein VFN61_11730 [Acidimicrobiales bacterium]|nr:hypothetical protein [Acidimicrobiales bacterium]